MISLCMDTSNKYLVLVLIKDNQIVDYIEEECFKRQSEIITVKLDELCTKNNIKPIDIDELCITDGPGSYTGIRIAMTIAKVTGSLRKIPVYTLNPFLLYSHNNPESLVLIDARSNRAYYAYTNLGDVIDEGVLSIEEIKNLNYEIKHYFGDVAMIEEEAEKTSLANGFLVCKKQWKLVENIHTLTPRYFKSNEDYVGK